ncbi:SDR family oxidoreductase [Rhizobium alvei]|uniref:Uncharacterized protein n=1 Tax=Rhizobium alvei TaxID=1132659 RepID=A0ABT8YH10_9HYPH|nr:hypothetical protein [Rhizobium alvei]MDO6962970.1 hypothetical protein [Rhizobium alvei]
MQLAGEDAAPTIRVIEAIMAYTDTAMTEGRDGRKLAPARAARDVVEGIERGQNEIWVGNTHLLRLINRLSPRLAARILRNG